jgi:Do/DeqQ family serine protease
MNKKKIKNSRYNFLLGLTLINLIFIFSSCQTNWSKANAPQNSKNNAEKQVPQAPVVVDGVRTSYADLVQKSAPAVVQITAISTTGNTKKVDGQPSLEDLFNQLPNAPQQPERRPTRGFGSGVIVKVDGTILTNHHVIDGADKISVETSDNKTFQAKVIGSDPPSDLAVLKIEGEEFPFLTLGDSDQVRVGDIVLAIGNPLGIGQSVTSGIISAKGRQTGLGDGTSFQDFLQTDAPINQGNSGGALINVNGELIGINSQILSRSGGGSIGIGFAIPSNMSKSVMEQLLENGKVRRGMLGVNIQDINSDLAETLELADASGVIVSNVRAGSAAEKAGVKRGDIIVKINGEKVEDGNGLRNKVASTSPNTEITLTIVRENKEQNLKVTLDEFEIEGAKSEESEQSDKPAEKSEQNGKLGLSLQPLTAELGQRLNVPANTKGVVVTDVDAGSPADEKGIRKGDVILEINRKSVASLEDVRSILDKSGNNTVLLLISRAGQTSFVTVKPKG